MNQQSAYKVWGGYAFESICMKHVPSIKKALNISGVYTNTYSYAHKRTEDFPSVQVDMLLERADGVINFFRDQIPQEGACTNGSFCTTTA